MESYADFQLRMERRRLERKAWVKELEAPKWQQFVKFIHEHRKAVDKGAN